MILPFFFVGTLRESGLSFSVGFGFGSGYILPFGTILVFSACVVVVFPDTGS